MAANVFYWTGVAVWLFGATVLLAVLAEGFFQLLHRNIVPSFHNLRFAVFPSPLWKDMTYYDRWKFISSRSGLRNYYRRRHNNYSRQAYRRLVREARRESLKKANHVC